MDEAFNSLFKAESARNPVMRKSGWRGINDVESAVAEHIGWYYHRRLHGEIGHIPPLKPRRPTGADTRSVSVLKNIQHPLESSNQSLYQSLGASLHLQQQGVLASRAASRDLACFGIEGLGGPIEDFGMVKHDRHAAG
ncbi:hypothetical protein [Nesterenkonia populi]|uniref:hypothetical protein n=1 Tax=Nesterenkonia populi TaxID=1591087 RepID=UPI0011BED7A2|nr:hypothetical protein [Nesterenkonia populi]